MARPDEDGAALPLLILRSALFYLCYYTVSAALVLVSAGTLITGRRSLFAMVRLWSRWHRWCCRHILGIRVVVEGALPQGKVLCAVRHESFFEALDLPMLLDNPVVFAKRELFAIPLWGLLARRYGLVAVDRAAGAGALRAMIAAALDLVGPRGQVRPLVIFPEGTRVPHGRRPALQAGFAGLYKMLALPVVPIAVDSGPLYHRWLKRGGVIRYRIAPPIPPGLPRRAVEDQVHAAINALNG